MNDLEGADLAAIEPPEYLTDQQVQSLLDDADHGLKQGATLLLQASCAHHEWHLNSASAHAQHRARSGLGASLPRLRM